jgi:hypothetical protein
MSCLGAIMADWKGWWPTRPTRHAAPLAEHTPGSMGLCTGSASSLPDFLQLQAPLLRRFLSQATCDTHVTLVTHVWPVPAGTHLPPACPVLCLPANLLT